MPLEYGQVGYFFHPIRYLMIGSARNVIFARFDLFHIHSNGTVDHHPEISRTPGHISSAGAGHQRFGGNTACIDTSASEQLSLDNRHLHPFAGQPC